MKFYIDYDSHLEQKQLIYRKDEYSFDMTPYIYEMDFDIAINTITLTVVDSKVVQLSGFCGLPDKSKMSYEVPYAKKGLLKVLHSEAYIGGVGSYSINKEDWAVSINSKTGWICIGDPQRRGNAVEFINKCISIINERQELVALWLHPCFV